MFSKLKTFSEDVAKTISDINNEQTNRSQRQNALTQLKTNSKILATNTPDASELVQPKDDDAVKTPSNGDNSVSRTATPEIDASEKTRALLPGVEWDSLPPLVQAKMKKFAKYEEKYPILLDAFKIEKRKTDLIKVFETVLSDLTPISSISDTDLLVEFIKGLNEKNSLLNEELKKQTHLSSGLKRDKKASEETFDKLKVKYEEKIEELAKDNDKLTKQIADLQNEEGKDGTETAKLELLEKEKSQLQANIKELETQIDLLSKDKNGLNEELKSSRKSEEATKNELSAQIDLLTQEKQSLAETTAKLEKDISSLKADGEKSSAKVAEEEQNELEVSTASVSSKKKKNKKKKGGVQAQKQTEATEITAESTSEIQKLKGEVEGYKIKYEELEKTHEALQDSHSKLKQELKAKSEDVENLRDSLRDVGDDLVETRKLLKEARDSGNKSHSEELTKIAREKEIQITSLKEELLTAQAKAQTLEEKVTTLQKDLINSKNEASSAAKLKEELTTTTTKLTREVGNLTKEKEDLNRRIAELSRFKSNDSSLKLEIASFKTSIEHKDKLIEDYKIQIAELNKLKEELTVNNNKLSEQNTILQDNNRQLINEKSEMVNKQEFSMEKMNQINKELTAIQNEKFKINNELIGMKDKYDALVKEKNDTKQELQTAKQQYEELVMKSKASSQRIENLEDELNETRNILKERSRETTAIKRILNEKEEDFQYKEKEIKLEIKRIKEEKIELENELHMTSKRKQREIDEFKSINENYLLKIRDLEKQYNELKSKMTEARSFPSSNTDYTIDKNIEDTMDTLRESLQESIRKARDLESSNNVMKKLIKENNLKFERLSKNYKLLTQQYKLLETKKDVTAIKEHSELANHSLESSPRVSVSSDSSTPQSNETNIAYLKNVLLGFFEHRDQREMLLPVLKTLFHFTPEDEAKFLVALK